MSQYDMYHDIHLLIRYIQNNNIINFPALGSYTVKGIKDMVENVELVLIYKISRHYDINILCLFEKFW